MIPLRDENPTNIFPFVTLLIIGINIGLFIYEVSLGEKVSDLIFKVGVIPARILQAQGFLSYSTLFSSMFFHAGLIHLLGNMLYLWIFGNNIEDALGHVRFFGFYLICGLVASLTHITLESSSQLPTIGASGAISGILGAYLFLYPKAKVLTLIPIFYFIRIVKIPAFYFLGFWILLQLMHGLPSLSSASGAGGVAWFAHIGGFTVGLGLIIFFSLKKKLNKLRLFR